MMKNTEAPTPGEIARLASVLTDAKGELVTAERRLAALETALADEQNDAEVHAPGAAERAKEMMPQVHSARTSVEQHRAAVQRAEAAHATALRARSEADEAARRGSIPGLARGTIAAARQVEILAQQLGEAMNELTAASRKLGDAIGTKDARRTLGMGGTAERLQHCLVNDFNLREDTPQAVRELRGQPAPFRFFPYSYTAASPLCQTRLSAAIQAVLDEVVTIYGSEAEAQAARERLDPSGLRVHVVPRSLEMLWDLVRRPLRGVAARRGEEAAA